MNSNVSPTCRSVLLVSTEALISMFGCCSPPMDMLKPPPIGMDIICCICARIWRCISSISANGSRACAEAGRANKATAATQARIRIIRPSSQNTRMKAAAPPKTRPKRPFQP